MQSQHAQSLRGLPSTSADISNYLKPLGVNKHAHAVFHDMLEREKKMANNWTVFYHSYTSPALIYEVQAAVAKVLFNFGAEYGVLPRLLKEPFGALPDARAVIKAFPSWPQRDCCDEFKRVGICCSTSLVSQDPEATPTHVFLNGYAASTVSIAVLEKLLTDCGVAELRGVAAVKTLARDITNCAQHHGLPQVTGSGLYGHLLQIFIKRDVVDKFAYASHPYGHPDGKRRPFGKHLLESSGPIQGQARLIVNPSVFMRAGSVRMHTASADGAFHSNRAAFQAALRKLLSPVLGTPQVRERAAAGIYGGSLPSWWKDIASDGMGKSSKVAIPSAPAPPSHAPPPSTEEQMPVEKASGASFCQGQEVLVLSSTKGGWVHACVTAVLDDGSIMVQYGATSKRIPPGAFASTLRHTETPMISASAHSSSATEKHPQPSMLVEKPSDASFCKGQEVLVLSATLGGWAQASVADVLEDGSIVVQYGANTKRIPPEAFSSALRHTETAMTSASAWSSWFGS